MANRTWIHAGSGNWNVAGNWSGAAIPNSGDDATLDNSSFSGAYTVTIPSGGIYLLNNLTIDGTSTISLIDNAAVTIPSTLTLQNASVTIAGQTSAGTIKFDGGVTFKITSGASVKATNQVLDSGSGNVISETGASSFAGNSADFVHGTAWSLAGASIAGFSGQIGGSGITFTFADATADRLTMGTGQGNDFFGFIKGFQLHNGIDLKGVPFASGFSSNGGGNGTALHIILSGQPKFTFDRFTTAAGTALGSNALTFASDGAGGTLITICFASGTRIQAEQGEIAVEALRVGDNVLTLDGGLPAFRPVRWIGRRRLDLASHPDPVLAAPVRILAGAFADNVPHRDLVLSPDHAVLADGGLVAIRRLINHMTIVQEIDRPSVEYFHVELDRHAILMAEGLASESYLDAGARGFFGNAAEPLILHPDMIANGAARAEAAPCVPFLADEAAVRPVWQRLQDRAIACGRTRRPGATSRDAALVVLAGGREILPVSAQAGRYVFALPGGTDAARLVSRSAAPADAFPWLDDRRRLGVAIGAICLRSMEGRDEIAMDHPDLSRGWWAPEQAGTSLQRWTNGDALIPLPGCPVLLELTVTGTGTYRVASSEMDVVQAA